MGNLALPSEATFRAAVGMVPDYAILMIDPEGRIVNWNEGARQVTGYEEGEVVGKHFAMLFTPEDQAAGIPQEEMERAADGPVHGDRWYVRKDCTPYWGTGMITPLRDASGRLRGYVKVRRDLTAWKQEEQQRQRLLEQITAERNEAEAARAIAEEASRAGDQFLATISHELRTPLTAIIGWLRLLKLDGNDPETRSAGVAGIEAGAKSLAQLIDDLLEVSRITTGRLRLNVETADLAPAIAAAIEAVEPAAEARGIRIEPRLERLPPLRCDRARMQQVAWNLLSNAVKFTPPGGRIEVTLKRVAGDAVLAVSDTGQGIEHAQLPRLFQRFGQIDGSSSRQHEGVGMGLAIVRHLVELHGGSVTAESPGAGRGATFTVSIPLGRPATAPSSGQ